MQSFYKTINKYLIICLCILLGSVLLFARDLGDVDGSGAIDIIDALKTAQYSVGIVVTDFILAAADVDSSGIVDIVDALIIAQYVVGSISEFPGQEPPDSTPTPTPTPTPTSTPTPTPTLTPTPTPCELPCPCGYAMVQGFVRDSATLEPIAGAALYLYETVACQDASGISGDDGHYGLSLYAACFPSYELTVEADGYYLLESQPGGIYCSFYEPAVMDIYLDPVM